MDDLEEELGGFTVYNTDSAPWGSPGSLANVTVKAGFGEGLEAKVVVHEGTWDRAYHGLRIPMPTRREPERHGSVGLSGMIRAYELGWEPSRPGLGVVFHGRCLAHEADAMRSLLLRTAARKLHALSAEFQALGNEALNASSPEVALPSP